MSKDKQSKAVGNGPFNSEFKATTEQPSQISGLDETTFSKLTQTLKEKLQNPKRVQGKGVQTRKSKVTQKTRPQSSLAITEGNALRGKKRDSAGKVVNHRSHREKEQRPAEQEIEQNELRREIEQLGGTEDDYDLVNAIESSSEIEGQEVKKSPKTRDDTKHGNSFDREFSSIFKEFSSTLQRDLQSEESDDAEGRTGNSADIDDAQTESRFSAQPTHLLDSTSARQVPGKTTLILPPKPDWFSFSKGSPGESTQNFRSPPAGVVEALHNHAKDILDSENAAFQRVQQSSSASSTKFYAQVMTSGTLTDKISALTLAVQESPLHNMKALENLLGLASKRSRAQAIEVLRALKDLFAQGTLLPSDRRLRLFGQQPSLLVALRNVRTWARSEPLPQGLTAQSLIVWAYEDWLKGMFFEVLKILETWCNDELEFAKARAISYVYELLKEKPEQEANLLRILINKLGDPMKKIASRTSYLLLQLEMAHPAMKETIISAIETDLLLRPNQSLHVCYYAVITLNQAVLSNREESVSQKLLAVYFRLFVTLLNPSTTNNRPIKSDKTSKTIHSKNRGKKDSKKESREPRQEDELREKVISAILTGVNRAYPFASADPSNLSDHMDTLFKITHSSNFNTSVQALMLIQQLSSTHQVASDRFYKTLYESLHDPRLASSSKPALYMNLLYKSLKSDLDLKRVKAFMKRILQMLTLQQPSFICGAMYLLHELEVTFPSLALMLDEPEDHDDGEEVFRDLDGTNNVDPNTTVQIPSTIAYDSRKRDPRHSHADNSCLWELLPFLGHFHPSVSLGAEHLLDHKALPGKPDLNLHTLSHFLDRFVYRNPKMSQTASSRGSSMMQPMAGSESSVLLVGGKAQRQDLPVNAAKDAEDVRPEDAFFHQYFHSLGKDKKKEKQQQQKKKKAKRDAAAADDEKDEEEIWDAMMQSRPDLEGNVDDSGGDEDLEMSDLDSDFEGSDVDSDGGGDGVELLGDLEEDSDDRSVSEQSAASFRFEDEQHDEGLPSITLPAAVGDDGKADGRKTKRRKLKNLPTFASADDYKDMVDDEEGED